MRFKETTYKTLTGVKKILKTTKKMYGQWIVYQNKKPTFLVDCFDFKKESNQLINNLVLSERMSITKVLKKINKKEKVNLSIEKAPLIEIELNTEFKELKLKPLPEKWLV